MENAGTAKRHGNTARNGATRYTAPRSTAALFRKTGEFTGREKGCAGMDAAPGTPHGKAGPPESGPASGSVGGAGGRTGRPAERMSDRVRSRRQVSTAPPPGLRAPDGRPLRGGPRP